MDKDSKKSNIFDGAAFFGEKSLALKKPMEFKVALPEDEKQQKMINDFDSSLILENIDKNVKNKAVKINLKISTLEKNLSRINDEYELLKLLNLEKDEKRREELKKFKDYLEVQLNKLKSDRKRFGIFYFLSGFFAGKIDCEKAKEIMLMLKNEVKKYDKMAISYLKSKNIDLKMLPFKW